MIAPGGVSGALWGPTAYTVPKVGTGGRVFSRATSDHPFSWGLPPDGSCTVMCRTTPFPSFRQLEQSQSVSLACLVSAGPTCLPTLSSSPAPMMGGHHDCSWLPRLAPKKAAQEGWGPLQGSVCASSACVAGCAQCFPAPEVRGPGSSLGGSALGSLAIHQSSEETAAGCWAFPTRASLGLFHPAAVFLP